MINTAFQPAQAALLPSLAKHARGADRRERQLEHDREPRLLRRAGARRAPARGLERLGRLRRSPRRSFLWSALMLAPLLRTTEPPLEPRAAAPGSRRRRPASARSRSDPRLRLVVGLFSAQTLVNGAFGVLIAVSALQLLDLGAGRRRLPERGRRRRRDHRRARLARARRAPAAGDDVRDRGRRDGRPAAAARRDPEHRGGARRLRADRLREHHLRRQRLHDPAARHAERRARARLRRPAQPLLRDRRARGRARAAADPLRSACAGRS